MWCQVMAVVVSATRMRSSASQQMMTWARMCSSSRALVFHEFPNRDVLWSGALQHAPDLMIAAPGAEAVDAGQLIAVLGELHVAVNTLQARVFVEQAPDPAAMLAAEQSDHRGGRFISLPSRQSRGVNSRTHPSACSLPGSPTGRCTLIRRVSQPA